MTLDEKVVLYACHKITSKVVNRRSRPLQLTDDELEAFADLSLLAAHLHPHAPHVLIAFLNLLFGEQAVKTELVPEVDRRATQEMLNRRRN